MPNSKDPHPPAMSAQLVFGKGENEAPDCLFAKIDEVLGDYWLITLDSLNEAKSWFNRCRTTVRK